jgi:ribonuclease P protein component
MLPREKRLTNERDYKRVYQKGSFFSVGFFNLKTVKNNLPYSRIGVVVTKKAAPKATDRNKIKRQIREAARKFYDILPAGFDVVITVAKGGGKPEYAQIEEALKKVFGDIKK